jgi:hypothetical protein
VLISQNGSYTPQLAATFSLVAHFEFKNTPQLAAIGIFIFLRRKKSDPEYLNIY